MQIEEEEVEIRPLWTYSPSLEMASLKQRDNLIQFLQLGGISFTCGWMEEIYKDKFPLCLNAMKYIFCNVFVKVLLMEMCFCVELVALLQHWDYKGKKLHPQCEVASCT